MSYNYKYNSYIFISTYKWGINNFNKGIYNIDDNKRERETANE